MPVSDTKGFPSYMKVVDVSVQDENPKLDFTDKHSRIAENTIRNSSVSADEYVAKAQEKLEEDKKMAKEQVDKLQGERDAALAELAELKAAKAVEDAKRENTKTLLDEKKTQKDAK